MKALFKIYSKAARSVHPITKVDSIDSFINEIIDDALENGYIDFDENNTEEVMGDAYEKVEAFWNKNKVLCLGDYEIKEADEEEENFLERPNMCGWDTSLIFG